MRARELRFKLEKLTLLAGLVCAVPGCAVYSTYHKCGFSGCPGDARITAEVTHRFGAYPSLQPPNLIRVQTLDRVVYLTGQVNTDTARGLADSVALQAAGAARVVDGISIEYTGR
jgi:osmotically-inducible protein OsmY